MSRRRSATVTKLDGAPWVAIVGGTPHEYKTRAGAVGRLLDEIDHWIRWARYYDRAAEQELQTLRSRIYACHGNADFNFTIAGLPGHCGLRKP